MAGVHGERSENGKHFLPEELPGPCRILAGEVRYAEDMDVVLGEGGDDFIIPEGVGGVLEIVHASLDSLEDFGRREAIGADIRGATIDLLFDAGDADLEELVEVRGEDREEFDPFEQRLGAVLCFLEDPAIELQPAQFPVDEIFWVGKIVPHWITSSAGGAGAQCWQSRGTSKHRTSAACAQGKEIKHDAGRFDGMKFRETNLL